MQSLKSCSLKGFLENGDNYLQVVSQNSQPYIKLLVILFLAESYLCLHTPNPKLLRIENM